MSARISAASATELLAGSGIEGATLEGGNPREGNGLAIFDADDGTTLATVERFAEDDASLRWERGVGRLLAAAPKLARTVVRLEAERDEARRILRSLVRYEVGNAHSHSVPCVWDPDNRPGVRGESCPRCHAFLAARLLLGLAALREVAPNAQR